MSEPSLPPELAAVRAALGGLAPAAPALDRDRLMYEAGRRGRRGGRAWPLAAAMFAGLSAVLGLRLAVAPGPAVVERIVYLPGPAAPSPAVAQAAPPEPERPADPSAAPGLYGLLLTWGGAQPPPYLRLRGQALRWGADGLPASAPGDAPVRLTPPLRNALPPRGDV